MLPKPIKSKSKKLNNNFLSDSEITKESEEVINAKKVAGKRRLILISLILTAGLSFIFWAGKGIQSFISSPHPLNFHLNFKLPSFNFKSEPKTSTNISDSDLNQFLSDRNWSVIFLKNSDLSMPLYQYNFSENVNDFISDLSKIEPSETGNFISDLPQGLLFQEKLDDFTYGLTITLPNNRLTFIIKDNVQSDNFPQSLSSFINQAYWYSVAQ